MKKRYLLTIAIVAASLLFGTVASAQRNTADEIFREALMKERAEGKLSEAIFRYERIVAEFPKERKIAAQALYQLSLAYEKLGDPRGKLMLTRLTSDYGNVEPFAGRGRTKLRAMNSSTAPSPFPEVRLDEFGAIGSPDGRYILLIKILSTEQIYLRDLSTGKERLILEDPGMSIGRIAWSPDSRKVVYLFKSEINILQLDNGQSTNLGVRGIPITWTLTDEIFFTRTGKWFLVPAAGGPQREVTGGEGSQEMTWLTITPDATRIIRRQDEKLVLVDLATGKASPITSCTGKEARPIVSPDGRLVAYASNFEGSWAVYVAPLDQGFPVKRPLRLSSIGTPSHTSGGAMTEVNSWWTRDGLLTLAMFDDESNIYRVNMDLRTGRATEAPQRLTQDAQRNYFPIISPDGRRIAYSSSTGEDRGSISVMDSNGANERPLLEESAEIPIGWRSPHELLIHTGAQGGGKQSISGLNLDSGNLQRVAQIDGRFWTYVPKRSEILSWQTGPGLRPESELKAVSLINGSERTVAVIKNLLAWPLAVSPDGETIAYVATHLLEGSNQRAFDLSLMSMAGVQQGVIASSNAGSGNGADLGWSPDGRFLLLPGAGSGPKVMDLRTRQSWDLHEDSKDQSWSGGNWSPDGSFVVITKWLERRERLAWEGVTAEAVAKLMAANK